MEKSSNVETIIRPADYIGSFLVNGQTQKERTEIVYKKLESMRNVTQKKSILLVVSLSGIKVCNETGESVRMAHALRRISYATSDPDFCQFSFLAREPKGQANVQYCHTFITKTPALAEELNDIVGEAFRMAYSKQKQPINETVTTTPSFNDAIERQMRIQKPLCVDGSDGDRIEDINRPKIDINREEEFDGYNLLSGNNSKRPTSEDESKKTAPKTNQSIPAAGPHETPGNKSLVTLSNPDTQALRKEPSPNNFYDLKQTPKKPLPNPNPHLLPELTGKVATSNSRHNRNNYDDTDDLAAEVTLDQTNNDLTPPWMYANRKGKSAFTKKVPKKSAFHPHSSLISNCEVFVPDRPSSGPHPSAKISQPGKLEGQVADESKYREAAPLPPQRMDSLPSYDLTERGCAEGESGVGTGAASLPRKFYPMTTDQSTLSLGLTSGSSDKSTSHDSIKDETMWPEKWYQPDIPRDVALDLLSKGQIGSFVVRDSSSHSGCYALSLRANKLDNSDSVIHYLIQRTDTGFKLKGLEKEWPTMKSLVTHLTVMPEMLPCTLILATSSKPRHTTTTSNPAFCPIDLAPNNRASNFQQGFCESPEEDEDNADDDDDIDYQRLSDFSSMMADLCLS